MTATPSIELPAWMAEQLSQASPDLRIPAVIGRLSPRTDPPSAWQASLEFARNPGRSKIASGRAINPQLKMLIV